MVLLPLIQGNPSGLAPAEESAAQAKKPVDPLQFVADSLRQSVLTAQSGQVQFEQVNQQTAKEAEAIRNELQARANAVDAAAQNVLEVEDKPFLLKNILGDFLGIDAFDRTKARETLEVQRQNLSSFASSANARLRELTETRQTVAKSIELQQKAADRQVDVAKTLVDLSLRTKEFNLRNLEFQNKLELQEVGKVDDDTLVASLKTGQDIQVGDTVIPVARVEEEFNRRRQRDLTLDALSLSVQQKQSVENDRRQSRLLSSTFSLQELQEIAANNGIVKIGEEEVQFETPVLVEAITQATDLDTLRQGIQEKTAESRAIVASVEGVLDSAINLTNRIDTEGGRISSGFNAKVLALNASLTNEGLLKRIRQGDQSAIDFVATQSQKVSAAIEKEAEEQAKKIAGNSEETQQAFSAFLLGQKVSPEVSNGAAISILAKGGPSALNVDRPANNDPILLRSVDILNDPESGFVKLASDTILDIAKGVKGAPIGADGTIDISALLGTVAQPRTPEDFRLRAQVIPALRQGAVKGVAQVVVGVGFPALIGEAAQQEGNPLAALSERDISRIVNAVDARFAGLPENQRSTAVYARILAEVGSAVLTEVTGDPNTQFGQGLADFAESQTGQLLMQGFEKAIRGTGFTGNLVFDLSGTAFSDATESISRSLVQNEIAFETEAISNQIAFERAWGRNPTVRSVAVVSLAARQAGLSEPETETLVQLAKSLAKPSATQGLPETGFPTLGVPATTTAFRIENVLTNPALLQNPELKPLVKKVLKFLPDAAEAADISRRISFQAFTEDSQ